MQRVKPGYVRIMCTVEKRKLDYLSDVWSEEMISRVVTRSVTEAYKRELNSDPAPNHYDFTGDE